MFVFFEGVLSKRDFQDDVIWRSGSRVEAERVVCRNAKDLVRSVLEHYLLLLVRSALQSVQVLGLLGVLAFRGGSEHALVRKLKLC